MLPQARVDFMRRGDSAPSDSTTIGRCTSLGHAYSGAPSSIDRKNEAYPNIKLFLAWFVCHIDSRINLSSLRRYQGLVVFR